MNDGWMIRGAPLLGDSLRGMCGREMVLVLMDITEQATRVRGASPSCGGRTHESNVRRKHRHDSAGRQWSRLPKALQAIKTQSKGVENAANTGCAVRAPLGEPPSVQHLPASRRRETIDTRKHAPSAAATASLHVNVDSGRSKATTRAVACHLPTALHLTACTLESPERCSG